MTSSLWRGWSPDTTCNEYAKLQRVADELLATLNGATSPGQFAEAQKSLLFLWQELQALMDPLHPRFPGGHRCLKHCYLEYAMRIRNKALILLQPEQPQTPAAPAPQQPPLTPDQVVNNLRRVAEELKRPRYTYLGNDAPPPQGNTR
jgi:hypothetical protein